MSPTRWRYEPEGDLTAILIHRATAEVIDDFLIPAIEKIEGRPVKESEMREHGFTYSKEGIGVLRTWQFLWRDRPVIEMHAVESGVKYALVVEELPPNMPMSSLLISAK